MARKANVKFPKLISNLDFNVEGSLTVYCSKWVLLLAQWQSLITSKYDLEVLMLPFGEVLNVHVKRLLFLTMKIQSFIQIKVLFADFNAIKVAVDFI